MTRLSHRPKNWEVREAADPTTPGSTLQHFWDVYFAGFYEWEYEEFEREPSPMELALAKNPNTPPDILRRLAETCPMAVAQNAAIPLNLILEPAFFHPVATPSLQELLRRPETPSTVLYSLKSHPSGEVSVGAAWHIRLHGESVPDLSEAVEQVFRRLPVTRSEGLSELLDLGLAPASLRARLEIAALPIEPSAPDEESSAEFTEIPPVDPEQLVEWLARGRGGQHLVPEEKPECSPSRLEEMLLQHKLDTWNVEARKCVAADARQCRDVLEILARHRLPAVRARIAGNPSAPATALERLSHSELAYELIPLASNPATPIEVIERLSQHEWAEVAGDTLLHQRLPRAQVERLAGHRDPWIRARAARHPACTPALLLQLAADPSREVRRQVAGAAGTPAEATQRMITPALHEAARDSDPLCRWIALTHPEIPTACLQAAARSGDWRDRLAAALNPGTPREATDPLHEDGNALVRAAARKRTGQ